MARKKTIVPGPELVTLHILTSFDGFRVGEVYTVQRDALVDGWVSIGLMEIVHTVETELEVSFDGEDPAGSGSAEPDVLIDKQA